ncbi:hypothetical protein CGRA01v4_14462 [Colletotrichum graminicola]|uniref:Uncharacterized protein n=1 Tax=Colletotrichum graminicola (strain M1.001 / M2 / FGSC 10212) TaxID=645133 RepID=E3Q4L9_COLGM|nr:uncharacterized protein GLRG_01178 [Colletotrichum graminicola M1.001]EFQ26034.1 hypothetical protein GLRG_01178 [Colletotrichum graminicola M1.001]WDK23170.1 hypothetical protein CGRA01v4_14462 [Colletotrichum graminicola]
MVQLARSPHIILFTAAGPGAGVISATASAATSVADALATAIHSVTRGFLVPNAVSNYYHTGAPRDYHGDGAETFAGAGGNSDKLRYVRPGPIRRLVLAARY